jgi:Fe-S cluster assembly protein SufD
MTAKTVVRRTRRSTRRGPGDFNFTRDLIPFWTSRNGAPQYLRDYHLQAWEAFEKLPMPTTKDEPWRRTDLRGLEADTFRLPSEEDQDRLPQPPSELLQPLIGEEHGGQIILTPTRASVELDDSLAKQGIIYINLKRAQIEHPDILEKILGQVVRADEGKFAALAAAMAQQGVLVYVPKGVEVEKPLHSILWGPGTGLAHFSHLLVWLDEGASLTYVQEYASPNEIEGQTLHAGLVEMHVGDGASLRFVELQSWGENVWNFSHERARVGKDGNLDWVFGALGSHMTKNFSDLDLIGEGSTGRMSGFYFTDGVQHLDHDTQQNHLAPHTTSDLLFKGALTGKSRSVWQGMIYVAPGAQQTDGYQANRNLVLSEHARADSIPGLEILADDVRCTHGATVGKIDPEEIFYLRSRGIPYELAEKLLVEGFFDPIMQRIPFEGVRARFQGAITEKMG